MPAPRLAAAAPNNGTVAIAISQPAPLSFALASAVRRLSIASRPPPTLRFAISVALSIQIRIHIHIKITVTVAVAVEITIIHSASSQWPSQEQQSGQESRPRQGQPLAQRQPSQIHKGPFRAGITIGQGIGGCRLTNYGRDTDCGRETLQEHHLFEIFGQFGPIYDLDLPMNRTFGTNRGTAYILYDHHADAEAAIEHMHEAQIDGSTINVSVSTQRSKLSPEPPMARRNANLAARAPFHGPSRGRGPPSGPQGGRRYGPRSDVYRPNPLSPGRSRSPRGAPPSRGGAAGLTVRIRLDRGRDRDRRCPGGGEEGTERSESQSQSEPEPQLRQRTERFAESRTELQMTRLTFAFE
ncbi:hypothetical protein CCMA1212_006676 [Trichoderma ghanense]|uniref:RRM domain-containing protein n=1 Tax=Trichoderma ghanense TaxID=65468 RepID=A0ABY2H1V0_9HYPO